LRDRSFRLPRILYVLTHNPEMFHVWDQCRADVADCVEPGYLRYLSDRYEGGVYVHWNFLATFRIPSSGDFCRHVLESSPAELVHEHGNAINGDAGWLRLLHRITTWAQS
jgi:hypothetical protein